MAFSPVHFDQVSDYQFSTADARDALYSKSMTDNLNVIAAVRSLRGSFAKVPGLKLFSDTLVSRLLSNLESLKQSLERIQSIEQRHVHKPEGRELFSAVLADPRVTDKMAVANTRVLQLKRSARDRCKRGGTAVCPDGLCDHLDLLNKQVTVRQMLDKAIEDLPVEDVPLFDSENLSSPIASPAFERPSIVSDSPTRKSLSEERQEYLSLTRDFWRQLSQVLGDMQTLERRCWIRFAQRTSFHTLLFFFMFFLSNFVTGFAGDHAPHQFHTFLTLFNVFIAAIVTWCISNIISIHIRRKRQQRDNGIRLEDV